MACSVLQKTLHGEKPANIEEHRDHFCITCKHYHVQLYDKPCKYCFGASQDPQCSWTPIEETNDEDNPPDET